MQIQDSVALVTGASRGLGKAFVQALLDAGAEKVYVAARHPPPSTDPRLELVPLDITNPQDISEASERCQDVQIP